MSPVELYNALIDYIEKGGASVMVPLVLATLVLWYTLGFRYMNLRRGSRAPIRQMISSYRDGSNRPPKGVIDRAVAIGVLLGKTRRNHLRQLLDDGFAELERQLKEGRVLVKALVGVAPLAGLLGTVIGMIETFDSLGDMSLFSQSGGIAGGISQALFTTQMGLSVAVPGVIVGRLLDRRQAALESELIMVKDTVCQMFAPEAEPLPPELSPEAKPKA